MKSLNGTVIDFIAYKERRDEEERGWLEVLLTEIVEKQQCAGSEEDVD